MVKKLNQVPALPPSTELFDGAVRIKLIPQVQNDGMPEFDSLGQKTEHISPRQVVLRAGDHTLLGQVYRFMGATPNNDNFHTFSRIVSGPHCRFEVSTTKTTIFLTDLNSYRGTWVSTCEPRGADNLDDHAPKYEELKPNVRYEVPTGSLIRLGFIDKLEGIICNAPEWLLQVEPDDEASDARFRAAADMPQIPWVSKEDVLSAAPSPAAN